MATEIGKPSLDKIVKLFSRFDTNNDGMISADELVKLLISIGFEISNEEVDRMMGDIDTDSDGFITLEEYIRGNAGEEDESVEELREAFDMYDSNNDGFISLNELHRVLERLGKNCTVDDCVKMIKSVDSDGDGRIDFEELKKIMSKGKGTSHVPNWVLIVTIGFLSILLKSTHIVLKLNLKVLRQTQYWIDKVADCVERD